MLLFYYYTIISCPTNFLYFLYDKSKELNLLQDVISVLEKESSKELSAQVIYFVIQKLQYINTEVLGKEYSKLSLALKEKDKIANDI